MMKKFPSKPSDIMVDHMLGVFGEQFKSAGMPKPRGLLDVLKEVTPLLTEDFDRKVEVPDPTEERRLKILQIPRSHLEDNPELKEQLSRYLNAGRHTPLTSKVLIDLLKTKYDLPTGTEVIEIVDVSSIMREKDIAFVMKLRNKDWDIVGDGEHIPIFNPKTTGEDEKPLTVKSRRKSYITI